MKFEQIESCLMVAKYMSITKAAEAMYISQSTVSRQISALEKEIGQPLFFRLKKNLQLTSAGSQLLGEFSKIYDQYTGAIANLKLSRSEVEGTLRFGYLTGTELPGAVTDAFRAFHAQHPRIDMIFSQSELPELLDGIQNGTLDMAVLPQVNSYGVRDLIIKTVDAGALRLVYPVEIDARPFSRDFYRQLEGKNVYVVDELQYPCLFIAGRELCDHMEHSRLTVLSNLCTLQQMLYTDQCVAVLGPDFDLPVPSALTQIELNPDRRVPRMLVWHKKNQNHSLLMALEVFARDAENE